LKATTPPKPPTTPAHPRSTSYPLEKGPLFATVFKLLQKLLLADNADVVTSFKFPRHSHPVGGTRRGQLQSCNGHRQTNAAV